MVDSATPRCCAYCGRLLAGYGADVVRLERPGAVVDAVADPRAAWLDAWYAAFHSNAGEALYLAPPERVRIW